MRARFPSTSVITVVIMTALILVLVRIAGAETLYTDPLEYNGSSIYTCVITNNTSDDIRMVASEFKEIHGWLVPYAGDGDDWCNLDPSRIYGPVYGVTLPPGRSCTKSRTMFGTYERVYCSWEFKLADSKKAKDVNSILTVQDFVNGELTILKSAVGW